MRNGRDYFCDNIRQYEGVIYATAYAIVKNEEDAADVIQESLLKAYCSLDTLRDKKQFRPWILSIVHNTAIGFLRKSRGSDLLQSEEELAAPEPAVDPETKLTVWEAIQKLKLPYRLVVILYYYNGYSVQQISQVTDAPAVAVRQQLSRGRKMLAKLLNKEDFL